MQNELFSLLIVQTWQVTALIAVVWIVVRLFGKDRPHLSHALWLLVLIKVVTPPIWSSPTSPFSWLATRTGPAISQASSFDSKPLSFASRRAPIVVRALPYPDVIATEKSPTDSKPDSAKSSNTSAFSTEVVNRRSSVMLWIWIAGAGLGLATTTARLVLFLCWMKRSQTGDEARLSSVLDRVAHKIGFKRRIRIRILASPVGPVVLGWIRPTILLPDSIVNGKSSAALEPLLAHELIHIRRGDLWWALVQTVAKSLFWFHPLVWFAAQMVTRESERSCDEETVASLGCLPAEYARGLLDVLEHKHRLRFAPALPGVRPVDITSARLERVMKLGQGSHRRTPVWVWLVLLICGAAVLPGAALVMAQESNPKAATPMVDRQDAAIGKIFPARHHRKTVLKTTPSLSMSGSLRRLRSPIYLSSCVNTISKITRRKQD